MLFSTLGASLLGNILARKREIATSKGREANMPRRGTIRPSESTITAGQDLELAASSLTNFEMQKYYQNEPKFNVVYLRNNLHKIKVGYM